MKYEIGEPELIDAVTEWLLAHREPRTGDTIEVNIPIRNGPEGSFVTLKWNLGE